jgi:tryptophan synthase alpha chain
VTGPDRIGAAFARAEREGRAALVAFLAAGDPDYATTLELARAAVDAGADIIELGLPFSDPLADGPIIQAAYTRALAAGATTAGSLECAARVAAATGAPVVLMASLNPILAYGTRPFLHDAADAGVAGVLIPDLPVDEAQELRDDAAAAGLATVFLVAPDSAPDRVRAIARASTGFAYLLRRRGITGSGEPAMDLDRRVAELRAAGPAPVAVGFGIGSPRDAAEVALAADGVVVGSVLVAAAHDAARQAVPPDEARSRAVEAVASRIRGIAGSLTRKPAHTTGGGAP